MECGYGAIAIPTHEANDQLDGHAGSKKAPMALASILWLGFGIPIPVFPIAGLLIFRRGRSTKGASDEVQRTGRGNPDHKFELDSSDELGAVAAAVTPC